MTEELRIERRPELRRPALVCVFRGWNDGGQGVSLAGSFLAGAWSAEKFAEIDPELFFDFQATRPHISFAEGTTRRIDWPENGFFSAALPAASRDVVLLLGTEPNLRWRSFCRLVTGFAGALHDACRTAGIPSLSLWAAVPHYVSMTPSPRAAKALSDRLAALLEIPLDTAELDEASEAYMQQVSEAVAADSETAAYVDELEHRIDETLDESDLPTGDTLAAELTRFLREREQDDDGAPPFARGNHWAGKG